MSVFLVTFRIHSDATYSARYQSFQEALLAGCLGYWREPTSFVAVSSAETIDAFCSRIYVNSSFDASKDMYLVLDANVKTGRVRGNLIDQDLFKLMPFVIKL
jgi:hypothetical protein